NVAIAERFSGPGNDGEAVAEGLGEALAPLDERTEVPRRHRMRSRSGRATRYLCRIASSFYSPLIASHGLANSPRFWTLSLLPGTRLLDTICSMAMTLLSVLDQSPIRSGGTAAEAVHETLQLAEITDRLGYHRYWLAEHHSSGALAGSSPEVLIGQVANRTM